MRAFRRQPQERSPALRACDADRDRVVAELRERFADGYLAQDSFVFRVDAALRARWRGDLARVVSDLPGPRVSPVRAAAGRLADAGRAARRRLAGPGAAPRVLVLPSDTRGTFTIGRDAGCDLVLTDMSVSRSHAGLRHESGRWLLSDAGSTNGTRLNGWRVSDSVPVRTGDKVSFGSVTFVVSDHSRPAAAASGTP
jgi:hypothetical protein